MVLVTGTHRSGTTWVGKTIALSKKVYYIHEPLPKIPYNGEMYHFIWDDFTLMSFEEQKYVKKYLKSKVFFSFSDFISELYGLRKNKRRLLKELKSIMIERKKQISNAIPLIKDPFAIFTPRWFEKNFNCKIIIMIRHPAAFVGSLKAKDWDIRYKDLLDKYIFKNDKIYIQYRGKIIEYGNKNPDIVDQGILFWNLVHKKIIDYQKKYPEWLFIKHEDISINPIDGFKRIFEYLNLPFNNKIKNYILETTNNNNSSKIIQSSTDIFNIKRNSKENLYYWKKRLTSEEIERVFEGTKDVAKYFYNIK